MRFPLLLTLSLLLTLAPLSQGREDSWRSLRRQAQDAAHNGDFPSAERYLSLAMRSFAATPEEEEHRCLILYELAGIKLAQGNLKAARELMQQCLAGREKVLWSDHPDTRQARAALARLYKMSQQYADALELVQKELELEEHHPQPDGEVLERLSSEVGNLLNLLHRFGEAERYLRESLKLQSNARKPPDLLLLLTNLRLAESLLAQHKVDASRLHLAEAIKLSALTPEPAVSRELDAQIQKFIERHLYPQARPLAEMAARIAEQEQRTEALCLFLSDMAECDFGVGNYSSAERVIKKAYLMAKGVEGRADLAIRLNFDLGRIYLAEDKWQLARSLLEAAHQSVQTARHFERPRAIALSRSLTEVYVRAKDYPRAEAMIEHMQSLYLDRKWGPRAYTPLYLAQALLLSSQARYDEARDIAMKALKAWRGRSAPKFQEHLEAAYRLAWIEMQAHNYESAREYFEDALQGMKRLGAPTLASKNALVHNYCKLLGDMKQIDQVKRVQKISEGIAIEYKLSRMM